MTSMSWQASLLDGGAASATAWPPDPALAHRVPLADGAWVDRAARWLPDADGWFDRVVEALDWQAGTERIRGEEVARPRLTWHGAVDDLDGELAPLREVGQALSAHYGVRFERLGANLYRDGRDSVAWHGDRVARDRDTAVIAIVSLGEPRRFRLRPRDGGSGPGFDLGHGDLLVMGGTCQRTWRHAVPKVARAGPRISLTYRHAYPPRPS